MKRKVVAENYLCFLALLEMIIEDELGVTITQRDLAEEFGVIIPPGYELNITNKCYGNNDNDYGVHLNETILNNYFEKKNISIRATYFHINPFEDLELDEYDNSELRRGKHIIYTYSYGDLFHENDKLEIGHVALLWEVASENELLIYDPGPRNAGIKKVNRHNMYDAMRYRHGGIYVLERLKEYECI